MTEEHFELIEPTEAMEAEFADFAAECRAASGVGHIHGGGPFEAVGKEDFAALVRRSDDWAHGRNLPDGYVPGSTYWLVRGRRILATVSLRHELNDHLRQWGGHIGYTVRPSERKKGYGTLLLRLTLARARAMGIDRALVTCNADNLGSAGVIQNNGGVLESEAVDPSDGKLLQRYWIDLTKGCAPDGP